MVKFGSDRKLGRGYDRLCHIALLKVAHTTHSTAGEVFPHVLGVGLLSPHENGVHAIAVLVLHG